MSLTKRLSTNVFWYGLSEFINSVALFVFSILIAQQFSVEIFGKFNFALLLTGFLGVFIEFGLTTLVAREIALKKERKNAYLILALLLRMAVALISLGLLCFFIFFTKQDQLTAEISYLLFIFIAFFHLNNTFFSIFRAFEKNLYLALARFISSAFIIIGAVIFFINHKNIIFFSWLYPSGAIIALGTSLLFFLKLKTKAPQEKISHPKLFKFILKELWPFALSSIFVYFYNYSNTILLGLIKDKEAVGYYNIAYKIFFTAIIVVNFIYDGVFPIAVSYAYRDKATFKKILEKTFTLIFNFALIFTLTINLFAANLLNILFGEKYNQSVVSAKILAFNVITLSLTTLAGHLVLDVYRKQKLNTAVYFVGAIINIVLNFILISRFSFLGAAVATIITELIIMTLIFTLARKFCRLKISGVIFKSVLAALITYLILILIPFPEVVWLKMILILPCELTLLLLFKVFRQEDIDLFKKIFAKKTA